MSASLPRPLFVPICGFAAASSDAPACLPATIPGVLLGEGVFETFLVRDGVAPSYLRAHEERLIHSAHICGFPSEAMPSLSDSLPALLNVLPAGIWRVRFTVLRGHRSALHCFWTATEAAHPPDDVTVQIAAHCHDPADPMASAKTVSRIASSVARAQAQKVGAFEAIVKTTDGDFAEGTASNIFVVSNGELVTPPLTRGILAGTTREALLLGCRQAEIPVYERPVLESDLLNADELWLTNAIIGVLPVTQVLGLDRAFPGKEGQMLSAVRQAYQRYLSSLC